MHAEACFTVQKQLWLQLFTHRLRPLKVPGSFQTDAASGPRNNACLAKDSFVANISRLSYSSADPFLTENIKKD